MRKLLLKRKKKEEKPPEEEEWWKEGHTPPPPKKETVASKLKTKIKSLQGSPFEPKRKALRPDLKSVLALFLACFYGFIIYLSALSTPIILLLLVPTIFVLLDYIKMRGQKRDKRDSSSPR